MKMIRAILRPESTGSVTEGLSESGYYSLTKSHVFGRGKQKGITIGKVHYDELPKICVMLVVEDRNVEEVIGVIKKNAFTGNYGDGKIFISPVDDAYTVRTGESGL